MAYLQIYRVIPLYLRVLYLRIHLVKDQTYLSGVGWEHICMTMCRLSIFVIVP